jgi:hypothetical protein
MIILRILLLIELPKYFDFYGQTWTVIESQSRHIFFGIFRTMGDTIEGFDDGKTPAVRYSVWSSACVFMEAGVGLS